MIKKQFIIILNMLSVSLVYAEGGYYINGGLGVGSIDSLPSLTAAVAVNAGYNFNQNLALELGWLSFPSNQWGMLDNYNVYDAAIRGSVWFGNRVALYGKLGVGADYSSWSGTYQNIGTPYYWQGSTWGGAGIASIGAEFKLSHNSSLYLENNNVIPVIKSTGSFGSASGLVFGYKYSFGSTIATTANMPIAAEVPVKDSAVILTPTNPPEPAVIADANIEPQMPNTLLIGSDVAKQDHLTDIAPKSFCERISIAADGTAYLSVVYGDSLYSIANKTGVPITSLIAMNKIKNNKVKNNEVLKLGILPPKANSAEVYNDATYNNKSVGSCSQFYNMLKKK